MIKQMQELKSTEKGDTTHAISNTTAKKSSIDMEQMQKKKEKGEGKRAKEQACVYISCHQHFDCCEHEESPKHIHREPKMVDNPAPSERCLLSSCLSLY